MGKKNPLEVTFEVTEHGGIDPKAESPRFVAKHLSAYEFVRRRPVGNVLEIGFGDGYGSNFLAQSASAVTGIDLFEANVTAASMKYRSAHLKFLRMDATELKFQDSFFDQVVSFQVIEHIPQALLGRYLEEIRRVLRPGGTAYLSTLNLKKNLKDGKSYEKSPHHDKEFLPEEFRAILAEHFVDVTLWGLYPTLRHAVYERLKKSGVFRGLPERLDPVGRFYARITTRDFRWAPAAKLDDAIDLMGVCRKA